MGRVCRFGPDPCRGREFFDGHWRESHTWDRAESGLECHCQKKITLLIVLDLPAPKAPSVSGTWRM